MRDEGAIALRKLPWSVLWQRTQDELWRLDARVHEAKLRVRNKVGELNVPWVTETSNAWARTELLLREIARRNAEAPVYAGAVKVRRRR